MNTSHNGLVICGTDTDVGKTIVSSFFVQGLQATYWKPIQSGLEEGSDTDTVCKLLNLKKNRSLPEVYKFNPPVSPHWAAEREKKEIDTTLLTLPSVQNFLIIETAGGLMVPITRNWLQIDQLKVWDLPVIIVARSGLGTINHTLLSIEALRKRNVPIIGLVLNGPLHPDNPKTLEQIGRIPIIAQLPHLQEVTASTLAKQWGEQKWEEKFRDSLRSMAETQ